MFKTHYKLERYSIGLAIGIIVVASIGGIVEIAPLFTIHQTVEKAPDMRVYTPLELLRLPQPDDSHAARRGRALRPLLARGRVAV
jgi:hypothetical protein